MTCCGGAKNAPEFDPDFEGPSDADIERFGADTHYCPSCKTEIWDGASLCPTCGLVLDDVISARSNFKNAVITVGLIAGGVAFVLYFVL